MIRYSKKQIDYFDFPGKPYEIVEGSIRSGKTWITCLKFLKDLVDTDRLGYSSCIIGKTEGTIKRNVIHTLERMLPSGAIKSSTGMVYIYGHRVYLIGANDSQAETKIRGMTLARLYGDEVTTWPQCVFDMALTRLSVDGARLICTTNPDSPQHWFYKKYQDVINGVPDEDAISFHFDLDDNLTLSEEYKERVKRQFSGVFYDRFIRGLWVVAEGLVYSSFNPRLHVIRSSNNIKYERYIAGVDFGIVNPMACVIVGITSEGCYHVLYEYYQTGKLTQDLSDWIMYHEKYLNMKLYSVYCDSAEPDRILSLKNIGINAKKANKQINAGLNTVGSFLKLNQLFIDSQCEKTIEEFQLYSYPEDETCQDIPIKSHDHAMDALRYCLHSYELSTNKKYNEFLKSL